MAALGAITGKIALDISGLRASGATAAEILLQVENNLKTMVATTDRASAQLSGGLTRSFIENTAALEGVTRGMARYAEIEATVKGINLTPEVQAQIDKNKALEQQIKNNIATNGGYVKSSKELGFALRNVPAQFSDIVVSLQGGQKPLTVFLQQGAQLKDLFGGAGNAAKALSGYILGLVNPFTIAAAAVVGFASAYAAGANESTRLNTALINTGNIAGTTAGSLTVLASQVGALTGKYSLAREATEALAASGVIAGRDIPNVLKGVVASADLTGRAVKEVVKDFEKLATEPLKGLVELNKAQNFLTVDIYKQVAALEKQGKTQEAASLAQKAYADTLQTRASEVVANLGLFEKAWKGIKEQSAAALDIFLKIGRSASTTDRVQDAQNNLNNLKAKFKQQQGFGGLLGVKQNDITDAQIALDNLKRDASAIEARAASRAVVAARNKSQTSALAFIDEKALANNPIEKINREFAGPLAAFAKGTKEFNDLIKLRDDAIAKANAKANAPGARAADKLQREAETAADREQKSFQSLLANIKQKNAEYQAALLTNEKLAQSDANQIKLNELLANSHGALAKKIKDKEVADINAAIATQRSNEVAAAQRLFNEQTAQSLEKSLQASQAMTESEQERVAALQRQIDVFGLSEKAVSALEAAKINDAVASYEQGVAEMVRNGAQQQYIDFARQEIDLLKERAKAREQFGIKTDELEGLKEAKKAREEIEKEAKKYAEDTAKYYFDTGKKLWDSFTTQGGNAFKNLRQTAKTIFFDWLYKALAQKFTLNIGVSASGVGGLASLFSGGAQAAAGGGVGGIGNILGTLKTGISSFTNGTSFLTSGIEKIGVLLSNGNGGILDTLGGFLGGNAGAISGALPYADAALQLLQGNIKGAAFTAAGAAIGSFIPGIGTAIGAALGGALGGIFGKKKIPRFSSQVLTTFNDGVFNTKNGAQIYKPLGAESSLSELAKQFSTSLGGFLKGFGLDDNVSTKVDLLKKRKKSYGIFEAAFDGQTIVGSTTGKAKNVQDTFNRLIETVLGDTLAKAIQKSSVVKGITGLFEGLTDKAVVLSLITATTALNAQSAELTKQFNLSVDAAGRVVQASGAAGQGLADFANKLALVAQSSQTVGDVLVKSRADLSAELGKVYGDIVQEAITSTVTKKVPVANTASSLFGSPQGGFGIFGTVQQQFKTVTEQVTTYVDKLISKSIELPASLAEYDALLKSIDKSTEGGAKQFADIFKLRDSAAALFASQDALKGGVANATFDLRSPAAQRKIREDELNALLGRLGVGKPTGLDGYLKLADGLDVTTKAGADLAAAFPTVIDLFKQLTGGVNDLGGAISTSRITEDFVQLADQRRYEAVARNYGTEFASDYTSNVEAGRIKNGKSASGNTDTALLEEIKALRKDFQVMAIDQTKLLKYQAKIDEIGIKVAA